MQKTDSDRRLLVLTYGSWDHASSRERALKYLDLLRSAGNCTIRWIPRVPPSPHSFLPGLIFPIRKQWLKIKRYYILLFFKWDLVFIQRLFLPPWILKQLQKKKVSICYDFDDAIYLDKPGKSTNRKHTVIMIQAASKVIISSPELLAFCKTYNCSPDIIATPVDTGRIIPGPIKADDSTFTIGWIGSPSTTKYLEEIAGPLTKVSKIRKINLLVVGADLRRRRRRCTLPDMPITRAKWDYEREPQLLQQMTIGIMPLPDNEWTRAKAGYKLLLYMSAGLAVIASPVGINKEIIVNGETGFLAQNQDDWVKYFIQLCDDPLLRNTMGARGRDLVRARFERLICFKKLEESLFSSGLKYDQRRIIGAAE
jgi:glycosyltransferase involved in cell wall biosynthesis